MPPAGGWDARPGWLQEQGVWLGFATIGAALVGAGIGLGTAAGAEQEGAENGHSKPHQQHLLGRRGKAHVEAEIVDADQAAAAERLRLSLGTKVEILAKSRETGEIRIHGFHTSSRHFYNSKLLSNIPK
jgi:hypothetical protein